MWVNHHGMFERIAHIDRGLLFLNLGLLSGIAFLPFPTAVLAAYIRDDDNASTAAVVYGLTMVVIGLFFTLMIAYLRRHSWLLKDGVRPEGVRRAGGSPPRPDRLRPRDDRRDLRSVRRPRVVRADRRVLRSGKPYDRARVTRYDRPPRRGARAAESARLESVCGATHRGFESHSLRNRRGLDNVWLVTPGSKDEHSFSTECA